MPRLKDFDETEALDAAMRAFWSKGYEATSLQDLEKTMGLTRTSIYNAFGDKRSVFTQAVQRYEQFVVNDMIDDLENAKTAKAGIDKFFKGAINLTCDKTLPGGCLVALSAHEKHQHDDKCRNKIGNIFERIKTAVQNCLKKAKKNGELSNKLDVSGVTNAIMSVFTGVVTLGNAGFSKQNLNKAAKTTLKLLDI